MLNGSGCRKATRSTVAMEKSQGLTPPLLLPTSVLDSPVACRAVEEAILGKARGTSLKSEMTAKAKQA